MSKGVERVLTGLKDELKSKNLSLEIGKYKGFSDGSMKVLFYLPCHEAVPLKLYHIINLEG